MGNVNLHECAKEGRNEEIRRCLAQAPQQIDEKNEDEETPLLLAARAGHRSTVELLLEHRAMVNTANRNGISPLHAAASNGFVDVVLCLLENGAAIDAEDAEQSTPLHHALFYDRLECGLALINAGAAARKTNFYGKSCLDLVKDQSTKEQLDLQVRKLERGPSRDEGDVVVGQSNPPPQEEPPKVIRSRPSDDSGFILFVALAFSACALALLFRFFSS